jgi:hypothetical protein
MQDFPYRETAEKTAFQGFSHPEAFFINTAKKFSGRITFQVLARIPIKDATTGTTTGTEGFPLPFLLLLKTDIILIPHNIV